MIKQRTPTLKPSPHKLHVRQFPFTKPGNASINPCSANTGESRGTLFPCYFLHVDLDTENQCFHCIQTYFSVQTYRPRHREFRKCQQVLLPLTFLLYFLSRTFRTKVSSQTQSRNTSYKIKLQIENVI